MATTTEEEFNTFLASGDPIIGISDEQRNWILPFIENLRKDWLRSEIEKLERAMQVAWKNQDHLCRFNDGDQTCDCYNQALTSIITRYKEELLELENGK